MSVNPHTCPSAYSLLFISADSVPALKQIAKAHDISRGPPSTLFSNQSTISPYGPNTAKLSPLRAFNSTSTPRSERDYQLGHPYCVSNYVSTFTFDIPLTPCSDLWTVVKFVANHLSDQQNIKHTRISIGMLNSISGGEPPHSQIDLHRPIKWEDFSFNGVAAEKPFSKATSFSNLGYVRLPEGALNLALFQVLGLANVGFADCYCRP